MKRRGLLVAGAASALPASPVVQARSNTRLSWFCWHAGNWLADPASLVTALPAGSQRVLLGLDRAQMQGAATGSADIVGLLRTCHQAGLRVDLLLGEPSWVQAEPRRHLVSMLQAVAQLPFDGLNLDLEPDASLAMPQREWQEGALHTLAAARAAVSWPLALTTPGSELEHQRFVARLARAGVRELVPMVYVSFPHLVRERAGRVLAAAAAAGPGLQVTVAQSCEPQLPRGESWHRYGRQGALQAWAELAASLGRHPRFHGLAIQSLEAFRQAPA